MLTKIILEDNERRFYIFITLLSTILLIDDVNGLAEETALLLLSLPLLRRPITVIPMIFVASWNPMLSVLSLGAYYYYFIIFFVSMLFSHSQYGRYIGLTRTTLYCLLFAAYIAISGVFSISHSVDAALKMTATILLAFSVGLFECRDRNYVFSCILHIAIVASMFFSARALFNPAYYTIDAESFLNGVRPYISQTLMTQLNPNSAAQIIVVLSTIIFVALAKSWHRTFILTIPLLLNIYTLIYLGSRTSFYTIFFAFPFFLIYTSNLPIIRKFYLILLSAVIGSVTAYYITSVGSRLVVNSLFNDYGSGRFIMWKILWENEIKDYWLHGFGYGTANYRQLGFSFDADNLYIDLLCQLGIIGLILFMLLHLRLFRRAKSMNYAEPAKDFITVMLINFLIIGFGESVFNTLLYWGFIAIACCLTEKDEEEATDYDDFPDSELASEVNMVLKV